MTPSLEGIPPERLDQIVSYLPVSQQLGLQSVSKQCSESSRAYFAHIFNRVAGHPNLIGFDFSIDQTLPEDEQTAQKCAHIIRAFQTLWKSTGMKASVDLESYHHMMDSVRVRDTHLAWVRTECSAHIDLTEEDLNEGTKVALLESKLKNHPEAFREWVTEHEEQLRNFNAYYLGYAGMLFLPPEIGKFSGLLELNLGHNHIMSLPPEIGNLLALKRLFLAYNELTFLPPEIGELKELEILDLSHNHLEILPCEIGKLKQLEFLHLAGNKLQRLPLELLELTKLLDLDVSKNQLSTLPHLATNLMILELLLETNIGHDGYWSLSLSIDELK